ncbi:MAG: FecR domain-containing protein [Dysgonamonadaceae bacterium]|jgi:ferric-dicitrate binding protein FerR (iron transport regulator)|nr:FecR domain-containing protein [Dysgonamonadaceae bacterium]
MSDEEKQIITRLLDNEDFLHWIVLPTRQLDLYWNQVMENDAQQKRCIMQLNELLRNMKASERDLSFNDKSLLWKKIEQHTILRKQTIRRRVLYVASSVAASVAIFLAMYFILNRHNDSQSIDYQSQILKADVNEHNTVSLIRREKNALNFENDQVELVYDREGKLKVPGDTLVQDAGNVAMTKDTDIGGEMNHLIVPYGKMSHITLSDGTKIWINSGSQIIYPSVFTGSNRELFVEGEIYLEVAKNENKPFVVKTGIMDVTVLGTGFNVCSYKEESEQSILLVSGAISVKNNVLKETRQLKPSQLYNYSKATQKSTMQQVEIYDFICWKYGFLQFSHKELSTVLKRIQKHYNIEIAYDPQELEGIRVSGKLDLKEDIHEVMRLTALASNIQYKEIDNKIVVTLNKQLNE